MQKLNEQLKQYRLQAEELDRVRRMAGEAQSKINALIKLDDFESERAQRKLTDARSSLDIANARLKHLETNAGKLSAEIIGGFALERGAWNETIAARRAEIVCGMEEALRPFFNGDERRLKTVVANLPAPLLRDLSKAVSHVEFREVETDSEKVAEAERFCSHVKFWAKKLGLETGE